MAGQQVNPVARSGEGRAASAGGPAGPGDGLRPAPAVAYVLGSTAGGTGRHVVMLAEGCAARSAAVIVLAPEDVGRRFFPSAARDRASAASAPPGSAAVPAGVGPAGVGTVGVGPAGGSAPAAGGRPGGCFGRVVFQPVEIADRPRPVHDLAAARRLRRLLRQARPDVVHAHGLRAGALAAAALAGATARPPLVVTVHNAPPGGALAAAAYRALERIAARRADTVTCVSGDLSGRMARLGARVRGRALVPAPAWTPPAPEQVAATRAELAGDGRPVVLAIGRLAAQKDFATLIRAAAHWQGRAPGPVLAVAGDGPLEQSLREQASREGVSARFLGRRGDVPALLAAADVVVVPSIWEGQPLTVQEALRAGRPLVASRVGGIPDLTGEDGALLVPPSDPAALAEAILAVLDEPGLAARLSAAALARAAALPTPDAAVESALALYTSLIPRGAAAHSGQTGARARP